MFFEDIHKASRDYPYIDLTMSNINYVSHFHAEAEIVYVVSGSTKLLVSGSAQDLVEGDIRIVLPGEIHSFVSVSENCLYIMKLFAPPEFGAMQVRGLLHKTDAAYREFKDIIETIAYEDTAKQPGYRYAVCAEVNRLLLAIVRTLGARKITESERKSTLKKSEFLNDVNEYIEEHFSEKILLDDICRKTHYSKYYFVHLFKEITSLSFVEYLTVFRLEKAKALLLSGSRVTEVAMNCGFGNLRSFNRCFSKYYLTTPAAFKKNGTRELI